MEKALVFSIEEFSIYDGPGIRSTVFLKGCPLRCEWCHNPEGQSFQREIMKAQSGCENCGACLKAGYRASGKWEITAESVAVCPNRVLRFCGEEYTSRALVNKLEKNMKLLQAAGGGVTFSGGEPLAHSDFLLECLQLLKGKTNRALQTSGFCDPPVFERILEETDYVLYDLKLADDALHQHYTGVSNEKILYNFDTLCRSGKAFTVRTPLIPGVTDTEENLRGIAGLLQNRKIPAIDLLSYNKMAGGKYASVGRVYSPSYDESILCQSRSELFEQLGIRVNLM